MTDTHGLIVEHRAFPDTGSSFGTDGRGTRISTRTAQQILDGAGSLRSAIRAAVPEMETNRTLAPAVVEAMRGAGVFGMALPRSLGGPELSALEQFEVIESLSYSDASVGWCAMIGCDAGYFPGFHDDTTVAELYPSHDLVSAGKVQPNGRAIRSADGWRVSGRWDFGSGSSHADRFIGGVLLYDESGEMLTDEHGQPFVRVAHLPPEQVVVYDTWNAIGLRATGSNDFEVVDALVPDRWLFDPFAPMQRDDPLYRMPSWFVIKHAGILTALARRAVDEAVAACETKLLLPDGVLLIDRPATLETIARAEAATRSARAFVTDEIARVWDYCVNDGDLSWESIAPLRLALVNASSVAVEVTRSMFDLLTTTAIKADSVFAQLAADAAVANTHVITSHRNWVPLGARLTNRPIAGPTVFI
jgi:alkylation response protein AidB-like acyl-CoA dehydrogenase